MNATEIKLPSSAKAYLLESADELAQEQNFKPSSPDEMSEWLAKNMKAIAVRCSEKQTMLYKKLFENPETLERVRDVVLEKVYAAAHA